MSDQDTPRRYDLLRANELTTSAISTVQDMMEYHPWDADQRAAGKHVKDVLAQALEVIIAHVPPCPDRSAAIRKIREARMDCNSAITHRGKY